MEKYAIGIDLGTTCSCVAVSKDGIVKLIPNEDSRLVTPSYVSFTKTNTLVGDASKKQMIVNFNNTVYGIKRIIGMDYTDKTTQEEINNWDFEVVNRDGKPRIRVEYQSKKIELSPEDISSLILKKMKAMAENYLNSKVEDAVVTVPAYFGIRQREATKLACSMSGLNCLYLLKEPVASAIAYGISNESSTEKTVLVYDFGGGTFDCSILEIINSSYKVVGVNGDTHLGGIDIDNELVDYCIRSIKDKFGETISEKSSLSRLRSSCEKAKIFLSTNKKVTIDLPCITQKIDYLEYITRDTFEIVCGKIIRKTIKLVEELVTESKYKKEDIDHIVIVGGSSKIPMVRKLMKDYFNKNLNRSLNPEEAIAFGAAVYANSIKLKSIHPYKTEITLADVTPLSISNTVLGGLAVNVVEKNTRIPTKKTAYFHNAYDFQTGAKFDITEGERCMGKDNKPLGTLILDDMIPRLRNENVLKLTVSINEKNDIDIYAKETRNKNKAHLKINSGSRIKYTDEDIDQILIDTELNKKNDVEALLDAKAMLFAYDYIYELQKKTKLLKGPNNEGLQNFKIKLQKLNEWVLSNIGLKKEVYNEKINSLHSEAYSLNIVNTSPEKFEKEMLKKLDNLRL